MAILFHEPLFATIVEPGDQLFFYQLNTTTDLTVHLDAGLQTPAGQPVTANAAGQFPALYLDPTGNPPTVVLRDRNGVEKWTLEEFPITDTSALELQVAQLSADLEEATGDILNIPGQIEALQNSIAALAQRVTEVEGIEIPDDISNMVPAAMGSIIGSANAQANENSVNISNVESTGEGVYVIAFAQPMNTTNYIVSLGGGLLESETLPLEVQWTNKTLNSITVETWFTTGGSSRQRGHRNFDIVVYDP